MWADVAGEGDRTAVEPPGENTEPSITPAVGVTVPESFGEPTLECVGREVVEVKRVDRDALEGR